MSADTGRAPRDPAADERLESSAAKPWLSSYPPGVPATIDPGAAGTLVDIFDDTAKRYPDRPALESFGRRMTYGELAGHAAAVGSWLAEAGIGRGDRVAIMLPNVMAFPPIMFGVLMAGATVVNVNPLYTPRELSGQLRDSGARTIFVLENFAHTVQAVLGEVTLDRIVIVKPGDLLGFKGGVINLVSRYVKKAVPAYDLPGTISLATVVKAGRAAPRVPVRVTLDDVAFLQYTGGTTGVAKGAMLTHRNVAANVVQCELWLRTGMGDGPHIMVTALPLYHIFALTCCCMVLVRLGGCQLLIANPRDIPGFVKTLQTRPFTCISGVNTLYNALARAPGMKEVDFSKLTLCVAGGMATQSAVAEAWKRLTGKPIVEGYGLSETSPVLSINRLDIEAFTGTIGYPVSSTEVSVRVGDREVPSGEAGELCARGPQIMAGYWNRPDETAKVMTADGYFRTGDVAVFEPDGALRIIDRMKDMILVSGFNVYPNEVEEVVAGCPGIAEVAVIGLPDERSGETVAAYIVRSDPALTEQDVVAWSRERLAPYKVPHRIVFREALPKTNVGKVLRRVLREETAAPQT
ncbi:AMP-binding protein [Enterovirga rhinocerotis]|uniref:Long-chain-fatty-acid--CoA ligase n=1 Tax=Enterovirga rhinocerotis TaxID=1339210 RepID=A0A4R7C9V0_9HYPH|nr:AMP-binding protein [Enterovirga rhinocerotis]TDR94832.1 long-chain acyl-CoA synthetase [Enterovirga rhinocerotis]